MGLVYPTIAGHYCEENSAYLGTNTMCAVPSTQPSSDHRSNLHLTPTSKQPLLPALSLPQSWPFLTFSGGISENLFIV